MTPPPAQIGERIEPARARPVPFCRHGLAPPPRTRARVRVAAVPWRRALSSARTASCTSASLKRAPNASASSSTPAPDLLTQGALTIGPDLHAAAPGAGDRPPHEQQVVPGNHLDDLEPALGNPLAAHAAGTLDALEHTRRGGRGAHRARRTDVVRAVTRRPAGEVVALDRALEALALRCAGDLHELAGFELLHGHLVADRQLTGLVAKLRHVAQGRRIRLLEMAELRPCEPLLARGAEAELDGVVAVAIRGADHRDVTRAGLEHGHALHAAVLLAEALGHAELARQNRRHPPHLTTRGGSRCPRPPEDGRGAGASRPSSELAGGCRSAACGCGSRSARASPCP